MFRVNKIGKGGRYFEKLEFSPDWKSSFLISLTFFSQNKDQNIRGLWGLFKPMILVHNHRQGARGAWANVLNEFRQGIVTDENFEILN